MVWSVRTDSSFYGSWPALDWTPRGLWSIRKVQRLQTHGQPDGQPTSAAPSSSRLQLATNSKATDIIFWACRCGSWGSCGPQRCTYKARTPDSTAQAAPSQIRWCVVDGSVSILFSTFPSHKPDAYLTELFRNSVRTCVPDPATETLHIFVNTCVGFVRRF